MLEANAIKCVRDSSGGEAVPKQSVGMKAKAGTAESPTA